MYFIKYMGGGITIKTKVYLQSNQNECGLCAVATLASAYGFIQPIEFYRKKFYVGRDGLSIANLNNILKSIRFEPKIENIKELCIEDLKKRVPCILLLKHHYIVIEKIRREVCYIIDPAMGREKINFSELKHKFNRYIITVKKDIGFKQYKARECDFRHVKKVFRELTVALSGVALISIISNIITVFIPVVLQNIVNALIYKSEKIQTDWQLYICLLIAIIIYIAIIEIQNHSLVFLQCAIMSKLSYRVTHHGANIFYITDDTFTASKKRCLEFCEMLRQSGISFVWGCESRADVINEEFIRILYESGCHKIQFGMESADNEILQRIKKHVTIEQIENAVMCAAKYNMHIQVSYIVGHAFDTEETVKKTISFAKHLSDDYGARVVCSVNTPFPGTEQYEKRKELGIEIKTDEWEKYLLNSPIINTKHLSINQLRYYLGEGQKLVQ